MIKPTLIIGIGGTGLMALIACKERLVEAYDSVPKNVVLLGLDTDDSIRKDVLMGHQFAECVDERRCETESRYCWDTWNPRIEEQDVLCSTQQLRPVGRLAAFQRQNSLLYKPIIQGLDRLYSGPDDISCERVNRANVDPERLSVFIIGSVAGGTGSGFLLDIANLVRYAANSIQRFQSVEVSAMMILPDTFNNNSKTSEASTSLIGRSFAAFRELDRFVSGQGLSPLSQIYCGEDYRPAIKFTKAPVDHIYFVNAAHPGVSSTDFCSGPCTNLFSSVSDFVLARIVETLDDTIFYPRVFQPHHIEKSQQDSRAITVSDFDRAWLNFELELPLTAESKDKSTSFLANSRQGKVRGHTNNEAFMKYESAVRHYAHVDMPGHHNYVKNMITGAAHVDGAILVVAAPDGLMQATHEHVLHAHQVEASSIFGTLNKLDMPGSANISLFGSPTNPSAPERVCFYSKPHLNVGTMGHIDHGKTTLMTAITKDNVPLKIQVFTVVANPYVGRLAYFRNFSKETTKIFFPLEGDVRRDEQLDCKRDEKGRARLRNQCAAFHQLGARKAEFKAYDWIDNALQEKARGITINIAHEEYQTNKRHYARVDMPGHPGYFKNMITSVAKIDYFHLADVDVRVRIVMRKLGLFNICSKHLNNGTYSIGCFSIFHIGAIGISRNINLHRIHIKRQRKLYVELSMQKRERFFPSFRAVMERYERASYSRSTLESNERVETLKLIQTLADEVRAFRMNLRQNRNTFSEMVGIDILDLIMVENAVSELETARAIVQRIDNTYHSHLDKSLMVSCS